MSVWQEEKGTGSYRHGRAKKEIFESEQPRLRERAEQRTGAILTTGSMQSSRCFVFHWGNRMRDCPFYYLRWDAFQAFL